MSYITKETLEHMLKKEFKYKSIVIEEVQVEGKFMKVGNKKLKIHYKEED